MAQTAAVLDIVVRANSRHAVAGLRQTDKSLKRAGATAKKSEGQFTAVGRAGRRSFGLLATGAKAGGLALGVGFAVGARKAATSAVDLGEQINKTKVVFRGSEREILRWSKTTATSLGISRREALTAAGTFGNMLVPMGLSRKAAADMSRNFVKLSADMASFNNASPQETLDALRSGLAGESEPLRRFGVDIRDAALQQFAMKKGLDSNTQAMSGQQKALLISKKIFNDTKDAQGDFQRTSGSLANLVRILKAQLDNLAASAGRLLLPALTSAARAARDFLAQMQSGAGAGGKLSAALNSVRATIAGFAASLNISKGDLRAFGQAATNVFNAIRAVAQAVWPGIKNVVTGQIKIIAGAAKVLAGILTLDFRRAWNGIKQIFGGGVQAVVGHMQAMAAPLRAAASAAFGPIGRLATKVWGGIKSTISSMMRGAAKIFGDIMAGILRRFATLFDVAAKIPGIGSKFKGLADRARGAAREVDKVGESVKRVPANKNVRVNVGVKWPKILKDAFPAFSGGGSGAGWPLSEAIGEVVRRGSQSQVDKLDIGDLLGMGTPFGPLGRAKGSLGKFEAIGHRFGLSTTSGFRPGDPGWHGRNRARDLSNGSGPTKQMMAYAKFMASNFGSSLLELIYTPLGFSIKNGRKVPPFAQADHYDHVHVAAQRGAMVPGNGSGDKVRALLEPGEGIINRKAVRALGGRGAIDALNSAIPRFASGGVVARAAHAAGFRGNNLVRMVAEAKGESGWNERAVGDGGKSKGLWQIHTGFNPWAARLNLFDPFVNARAAMRIFRSQGVGAWYANHAPHMGAARRAVASLRGRARRPSRRQQRAMGGLLVTGGRGSEIYSGNLKPGQYADFGAKTRRGGFTPQTGIRKGIPFTPQKVPRGQETDGPGETAEDPRVLAMQALAEATRAQAEEAAGLRAEIAKQNAYAASVSAVGLGQVWRAVADQMAGQLGTMTAQRMAGPSTGALARY